MHTHPALFTTYKGNSISEDNFVTAQSHIVYELTAVYGFLNVSTDTDKNKLYIASSILAQVYFLDALENATHEEQRAVIRFLAAEGVKPNEAYRRMSAQYGSTCLNQRNVNTWMERFKEGCTSIKDEPRQGRPSEVNTPEKQQAVNDLILAEKRITVEEIAQQLDISTGTAHHIIREVLKFSKVSCRWVSKMLTPEHKQNCLDISRKLLDRFHKAGETFLQRIITCDETWAFHYEPETKQQSMEWKHTSSSVEKKVQVGSYYRKSEDDCFLGHERSHNC